MVSMLLIRVMLVIGLYELQVLIKANRSSVMLLAPFFWDAEEVILVDVLHGQTTDFGLYILTLKTCIGFRRLKTS
jgi:hypothetical protein